MAMSHRWLRRPVRSRSAPARRARIGDDRYAMDDLAERSLDGGNREYRTRFGDYPEADPVRCNPVAPLTLNNTHGTSYWRRQLRGSVIDFTARIASGGQSDQRASV